jgi:DNA-nicking Smr family endonuclease
MQAADMFFNLNNEHCKGSSSIDVHYLTKLEAQVRVEKIIRCLASHYTHISVITGQGHHNISGEAIISYG